MYNLYGYQGECRNALIKAYRARKKRALLDMASGLGKTITAAHFVKWWQEEVGGRTLVLCHQNEILNQLQGKFSSVLDNGSHYGFFTGDAKDFGKVDVLYASFQTMKTWRKEFSPEEFSLVVVDEGHHGKAKTYTPTLDYFKPKFMIGMTATVDRMDGQDIREIFGKEIYSLPLPKALADGNLLAKVKYRVFLDKLADLKKLETEAGKLSLAGLNEKFFIPRRDEEIAKIIAEYMAKVRNAKAMIFCEDIAHCKRFAAKLVKHVPTVQSIHHKIGKTKRKQRLADFRSGKIRALLSVDMLNEGIDVEDVNVVVFLRSTTSSIVFYQQLGRGLRRKRNRSHVCAHCKE